MPNRPINITRANELRAAKYSPAEIGMILAHEDGRPIHYQAATIVAAFWWAQQPKRKQRARNRRRRLSPPLWIRGIGPDPLLEKLRRVHGGAA